MNLLCDLGWHSPGGMPRWNDGFYFAQCRRCGCDLVRTAYQKWHAPAGYRVVWSADPPPEHADIDVIPAAGMNGAGAPVVAPALEGHDVAAPAGAEAPVSPEPIESAAAAELALAPPDAPVETIPDPAPVDPEPAPVPAAEAVAPGRPEMPTAANAGRLPISEVLDRLKAEDVGRPRAARATKPAKAPSPVRWSEDFMKDDPADELQIGPEFPASGGRPIASDLPWAQADDGEREPIWERASRRLGAMSSTASARIRRIGQRPAKPWHVIGAAIVVSILVALAVIVANPSAAPDPRIRTSAPIAPLSDIPTAPAAMADGTLAQPPGPAEEAVVGASVLSCRSAPTRTAPRIRNMMQGERVEVIGRLGDWVALTRRNTRCWAEARYVSSAARN